MTNPTTVEELLDYWPGSIPFKGSLVSEDGSCMCAQGQALHFLDGMSADDLSKLGQGEADRRVAVLLGISRSHSVLLRIVNDAEDGAPTVVVRNPERVIGDQAHILLAFWRHLDRMSPGDWITLSSARASARASAGASAWESAAESALESARASAGASAGVSARASAGASAGASARASARDSAWDSAWDAANVAAWATSEIQGAAVIRAKGLPFFFLPLFGFSDPEAVLAADKT
jgi:hypothetical protein